MFSRYASAVASGTVMTFGLLFVMQLLISLQPAAESLPRLRIPVNWIQWKTVDSPLATRNESIIKETLINVDPTPALPRTNSGLEPLLIHTVAPTPPDDTALPPLGIFTDGPLVALVRVAPVYPARALTYGIEGYVVVQFDVTAKGVVVNAFIVESTNRVFDSPAIKAAERFKFKPRVIDGLALESHGIRNLFRFSLDDQ